MWFGSSLPLPDTLRLKLLMCPGRWEWQGGFPEQSSWSPDTPMESHSPLGCPMHGVWGCQNNEPLPQPPCIYVLGLPSLMMSQGKWVVLGFLNCTHGAFWTEYSLPSLCVIGLW